MVEMGGSWTTCCSAVAQFCYGDFWYGRLLNYLLFSCRPFLLWRFSVNETWPFQPSRRSTSTTKAAVDEHSSSSTAAFCHGDFRQRCSHSLHDQQTAAVDKRKRSSAAAFCRGDFRFRRASPFPPPSTSLHSPCPHCKVYLQPPLPHSPTTR